MDTTTVLDNSRLADAQRQRYVPPKVVEYGNAKTITATTGAFGGVDAGIYLS